MSRPLAQFQPGLLIKVDDRMQSRYAYRLAEKPGRGFDSRFRPQVTPAAMLRRGVFEGCYLNDCEAEFPQEWFAAAKRAGKLRPGRPDPGANEFGVKSRLSLGEWRRRGWIPVAEGDPDVRGWFQWYCRYWLGRRIPAVDQAQIARWRAFVRHRGQILASYRKLSRPPATRAEKRKHRPRQRQALLQWAYDPYV